MKNIFFKIKSLAQRNKWWTASIILVVIILLFVFLGNKKNIPIETVIVQKHNLTEEVSATGNVKPLSDLDLSFETSGKISGVYADVGDRVFKGDILIKLDSSELYANLLQAEANLSAEQSRFLEIKKGTRPEELAVVKTLLDDAKTSLEDKIADAYTKADDAIRNSVDQMFDNPRSSSAKILIILNNSQLENDINSLRCEIELILNDWNVKGSSLSIKTAYSNLDKIKVFLDKVAFGVNSLTVNSNITQVIIDKYKAALSGARSSIGLAYANLNAADSAYNSAKSNYDLKIAGNTPEAISAQEARVAQVQAQVANIKAQLSKNVIYSPINGLVVKQEAKVGEIANPNVVMVSVISYGQYEVESFIPEADIAKIKVGDVATTTLDAYGSDTFFDTSVIKIDPAETIVGGVSTYKVTLKFASSTDARIKSGMTANLDILTVQKNDIIAVPSRSVYSMDSAKYVKLVDSKNKDKTIETKIITGIRGVDGYIEIVSGLKEGDIIVASYNL